MVIRAVLVKPGPAFFPHHFRLEKEIGPQFRSFIHLADERILKIGSDRIGLISIGILGLLMDRILLLAERRLTGWQERR